MPRNVAQWTGIAVTTLVVLGRDLDVLTALPLGVLACVLSASLVTLGQRIPVRARKAGS
ncbi:MAG TPA: hypothetical protein VGI20_13170 [Rhizomicrobium sp.]|jgi:hypothetical protein